jgi:aminoglycoside phosphotransferase (APT) family kinase protein
MMSIMRGREFSVDDATYIDAMVMELMEPETGEPFCGPAIAAAAKELWTTQTFRPSIPEFVEPVRKHQARLESDLAQLGFIFDAEDSAYEVLKKLAPEKLPKPRQLTEEEKDFWKDIDVGME